MCTLGGWQEQCGCSLSVHFQSFCTHHHLPVGTLSVDANCALVFCIQPGPPAETPSTSSLPDPCPGTPTPTHCCRYFAETSATLFTTILGQRSSLDAAGQEFRDYWLSDGTYGSFRIQVSRIACAAGLAAGCRAECTCRRSCNRCLCAIHRTRGTDPSWVLACSVPRDMCQSVHASTCLQGNSRTDGYAPPVLPSPLSCLQVAVDGLEPSYSVLRSPLLPEPSPAQAGLLPCRLWGNSDQDNDCVHKLAHLPALRNGDWLMFPYAGAYTICSASNFGGVRMTEPQKLFVFSEAAPRDLGGWGGAEQGLGGGADCSAHAGHVDGLMAASDDGGSDAAAAMVCGSAVAGDELAVGAQEVAAGSSGCACGMECEAGCPSGVSDGTAVDVEDGMEVTSAGPCC